MEQRDTPENAPDKPNAAQIDSMFEQGLAYYSQGRHAEAQPIFEKIHAADATHFDAVYLLGLIAAAGGNLSDAIGFYGRAIELDPRNADVHYNRGIVFHDLKQLDAALADYDRFIELQPDYPQVYFNRGNILEELGRNEEALAAYDRAIALNPDYALAYLNRGQALENLGRLDDALASYDRGVAAQPDYPAGHNNRANVLRLLGRFDDAVAGYDKAIALRPDYAIALNNRGVALLGLDRHTEALADFDRAIELEPEDARTHTNRGEALRKLGRLEEALDSHDRAIALAPDMADAHSNRGAVLQQSMRLDDAAASYRQALSLEPGHKTAAYNLSLVLLLLRRFGEAWPLYESRPLSDAAESVAVNPDAAELWQHCEGGSEDVLLLGERGLRDEIMFSSVIPEVLETHANTILTADQRLHGLFRRSFPGLTVIPHPTTGGGLEADTPAERRCFLVSLMKVLRSREEDFPGAPFLVADPERRKAMRARLDALGPGPKIGLMWQSGLGDASDAVRSLSLDALLPALETAPVHWISLNHLPEAAGEISAFTDRTGIAIHHWAETLTSDDYDDTAALVAELESVLSVTSRVAHCAAALGVPTHVLVGRVPEWRFGADGATMPWYRGVTLYRQTADWPVADAARALKAAGDGAGKGG